MFRSVLSFDMRAPGFGAPAGKLYEAALDMCAFGDEIGIDGVIFPEHHDSEDGYNPVPALMAAAAAARTKRMAIILGAIVLPLHDPVEVAETIGVTDNICGGRLWTALAAGHVKAEFAMFGRSLERRAAINGLGLWALQPDTVPAGQALLACYKEECAKHGRRPGPVMSTRRAVHVARDVEAAWEQIGPHVLHMVRSYAAWAGDVNTTTSPFYGMDSVEKIRAAGIINVMTPEQTIAFARQSPLALTPLISGLDPKIGWEMLELFAAEVVPALRGA